MARRAERRPQSSGAAGRLEVLAGRPLRVADVALFYGERSGGIRTYLREKAAFAERTEALDHHVVVPGRIERHDGGWHELRALRVAASNGYRLPSVDPARLRAGRRRDVRGRPSP
jgi:hypothetical protein